MTVRFIASGGGAAAPGGGSGPNPTDAFSLNIKTADSVPAATDAASFVMAMTFADSVGAPDDALKLGVGYADTIGAPTDASSAKWISNWLPATATVTDAVPPSGGNQWTTPDNAKLQDAAVAVITAASTVTANAAASSRLTLSGLAGTAPPAGFTRIKVEAVLHHSWDVTVDAVETVTLTATLIDSSDALLATIFTKVQGGGDQAALGDTVLDVTAAVAGQSDAQLATDKLRLDGAMDLVLGVASNATWSVDVGYLRVTHEKIGL